MNSPPVIRPEAVVDLQRHVDYISERNAPAALRLVDATEEAFTKLVAFPYLGASCEFDHPDAADLRFWTISKFPNYVIVYRPLEAGIEVVRIFHGAQDWTRLFQS